MGIKDEFLYDFGIKMPRLLISGKTAVIDNISRIALLTDTNITAECGRAFISLSGHNFAVDVIEDERMIVTGEIQKVEFYRGAKDA